LFRKELNKKINQINVGVLIPARNEEKIISNTIDALLNQELKPKKIILVNDGSKDNTSHVASSLGCEVIDLPYDGIHGLDELKMANVYNVGLKNLKEGFDYILELSSDHILPSNYISDIVNEMEKNSKLVISSGKIEGEEYQNSSIPRGSGRLIKSNFYKEVGMNWPKKYGAESYFVFKAWELGYKTSVFDILTKARKTGTNYSSSTFVNIGKACKALGYNPFYAIGTFVKRSIVFGNMKIFFFCLRGWLSKVELYDNNFRTFVNKKQKNQIRAILKKYTIRK